ncbi:MAG TPA: hypothetical protein VF528_19855 [Pyrinomonadaceae bacterium]|jgi:hypothetical protein
MAEARVNRGQGASRQNVLEKMDEHLLEQIMRYRRSAQSMGDAALDAMTRGDIGQARAAARQAAQHARIVVQLETGVKQIAPEDESNAQTEGGFSGGTLSM